MPPKNETAAEVAADATVDTAAATGVTQPVVDAGAVNDPPAVALDQANEAPKPEAQLEPEAAANVVEQPEPAADDPAVDGDPEPEPEPKTVARAIAEALRDAHKAGNSEAVQVLSQLHLLFGELRTALHRAVEVVEGDLKEGLTYIKASL